MYIYIYIREKGKEEENIYIIIKRRPGPYQARALR
jgi:hypothetical protein